MIFDMIDDDDRQFTLNSSLFFYFFDHFAFFKNSIHDLVSHSPSSSSIWFPTLKFSFIMTSILKKQIEKAVFFFFKSLFVFLLSIDSCQFHETFRPKNFRHTDLHSLFYTDRIHISFHQQIRQNNWSHPEKLSNLCHETNCCESFLHNSRHWQKCTLHSHLEVHSRNHLHIDHHMNRKHLFHFVCHLTEWKKLVKKNCSLLSITFKLAFIEFLS